MNGSNENVLGETRDLVARSTMVHFYDEVQDIYADVD